MTVVVDYRPDSEIINIIIIRNNEIYNTEIVTKVEKLFLPVLCLWNHQNSIQIQAELDSLKQASLIKTGKLVKQ